MPQNVFVTRRVPDVGLRMLAQKGFVVDVNEKDAVMSKKQLIRALGKKPYDAVLTLLTDTIDAEVFSAAPQAKIFANYATGYDNIDIAEAKKRGVIVTNASGNFAYTIAEHTMALILGLTTRMIEADKYVRKGKYKGWAPLNFIGTDVAGKTFGIIGAGRIGQQVAKHAFGGFDAKIIYTDEVRSEKMEKEYRAEYSTSIDDVLQRSDIVTLHIPLTDSTRHLINEERLRLMKPTAFLINTSRGPIVDENALVAALKKGTIAGAGLDVFEFEPKLAVGLAKLPNVILTPHIASARESARNEMARVAAQNIIDVLEGRQPASAITK